MKAGIVACFAVTLACAARASTDEIVVRSSDVRLTRATDGATVVEVALPEALGSRRIEYATLEFYVASGVSEETARPCMIRFVPVTSVTESDFLSPEGHWSGDVVYGDGFARRVVLDVTPVLKRWRAGDGSSLGALEARDLNGPVEISIVTDRLGTGVVAQLRVWTTRRP